MFIAQIMIKRKFLVGKLWTKFFSEEFNLNFNNENKIYVENYIINEGNNLFSTRLGDENYDLPFSILELEDCLNKIKKKSAPGIDKISYKLLTNLNEIRSNF